MLQRCACDAYDTEANDATYVRDGKPLCHERTCAQVKEHRRQGLHSDPGDEDDERADARDFPPELEVFP